MTEVRIPTQQQQRENDIIDARHALRDLAEHGVAPRKKQRGVHIGLHNELVVDPEAIISDDMLLETAAPWLKQGYVIWSFRVLFTRVNLYNNGGGPLSMRAEGGKQRTLMSMVVQYPISPEMDAHLRTRAKTYLNNLRATVTSFADREAVRDKLAESAILSPAVLRNGATGLDSFLIAAIQAWVQIYYPTGMKSSYDENGDIIVLSVQPLRSHDDPGHVRDGDLTTAMLEAKRLKRELALLADARRRLAEIMEQAVQAGDFPCSLYTMLMLMKKRFPLVGDWQYRTTMLLYPHLPITLGELRHLSEIIREMFARDFFKHPTIQPFVMQVAQHCAVTKLHLPATFAVPNNTNFEEYSHYADANGHIDTLDTNPNFERITRIKRLVAAMCLLSKQAGGIPLLFVTHMGNNNRPIRLFVDGHEFNTDIGASSARAAITSMHACDGHVHEIMFEEGEMLRAFSTRLKRAGAPTYCTYNCSDSDDDDETPTPKSAIRAAAKAKNAEKKAAREDFNKVLTFIGRDSLVQTCARIAQAEGTRPQLHLTNDGFVTSMITTVRSPQAEQLVGNAAVNTAKATKITFIVLDPNDIVARSCPAQNIDNFMKELHRLRQHLNARVMNDRLQSSAPESVRLIDKLTGAFAPEGVFDREFFDSKQISHGLDGNRHYTTSLLAITHFPVFGYNRPIIYQTARDSIHLRRLYYAMFLDESEALRHGFVAHAVTQLYGEAVMYLQSKQVKLHIIARRRFRWVLSTASADVRVFEERLLAACTKYNVTGYDAIAKMEINSLIGRAGMLSRHARLGEITTSVDHLVQMHRELTALDLESYAVPLGDTQFILAVETESVFLTHFRPIQDYVYHKSRMSLWRQMDAVSALGVQIRGIKVDEIIVSIDDVHVLTTNAIQLKIAPGYGNWKLEKRVKAAPTVPIHPAGILFENTVISNEEFNAMLPQSEDQVSPAQAEQALMKKPPRIMTGGKRLRVDDEAFQTLEQRGNHTLASIGYPNAETVGQYVTEGLPVVERNLLITGTAGQGKSLLAMKLMWIALNNISKARIDAAAQTPYVAPKGYLITWTHPVRKQLIACMDRISPDMYKYVESKCIQGLAPTSVELVDKEYEGSRTVFWHGGHMKDLDHCDVVVIDEIFRYTDNELEQLTKYMDRHPKIIFIANGDPAQMLPIDAVAQAGMVEDPTADMMIPEEEEIADEQDEVIRSMFPTRITLTVSHRGQYGTLVERVLQKQSVSEIIASQRALGPYLELITAMPLNAFYVTYLRRSAMNISRDLLGGRKSFIAGDFVRSINKREICSITSGYLLTVMQVVGSFATVAYIKRVPATGGNAAYWDYDTDDKGAARKAIQIDAKFLNIEEDAFTHYQVGTVHAIQGISACDYGLETVCICDLPYMVSTRALYVAATRNSHIANTKILMRNDDVAPDEGVKWRFAEQKRDGYVLQDFAARRGNGVIKRIDDVPATYVSANFIKANLDARTPCCRCGLAIDFKVVGMKLVTDFTIDRINNQFDHVQSNCQPAHLKCNSAARYH